MSEPLWKIKAAKAAPSTVSASDAYERALFWQSQRMAEDDAMWTKFTNGDIGAGYDELKSYLDKRVGIGGKETGRIKQMGETGLEIKTDWNDDLQENLFLNAKIDWADYSKYLDERKGAEAAGSEDAVRIETRRATGFEITQKAEESLWRTKFTTGEFSYDQYKEKLQGRLAQYAENSPRHSEVADILLKLTPEYRKNELDQLYNNKHWGEKGSDNLAGYISELKALREMYGEGSPEYVSIDGAITKANNDYTAYENYNTVTDLGNQVTAKQGDVNQKNGVYQNALAMYQSDPSAANRTALDAAWNAYNNSVIEYNSLFDQYQDAKSKPLADLPLPDIAASRKDLIGKPAEQILAEDQTQTDQTQTPTIVTDPYAGLFYLKDPKMIKWYGEDKIVRGTNKKVYLKKGIAAPRYVSNPKEIPKLGENQIYRDPSGRIYANPFASY